MIYTVKEQAILMLYSVILGAGIAIIYDVFCFYTERLKKWFRYIVELLLWLFLTFIASRYMLINSKGYLPIYTFGFFIIGIVLYYMFLAKDFKIRFRKLNEYLYKLYKRIRRTVFIIIIPKEVFTYLYYKIKRLFKRKRKKNKEEEINIEDNVNQNTKE